MTLQCTCGMCVLTVLRMRHMCVDSLLSYNGATSHVAVSHQTGVCVIVNKQIKNGRKMVNKGSPHTLLTHY